MRHSNFMTIILSLALSPLAAAGAEAADATADLGANAAMKYWQAFALLPTVDKDQEQLLEQWNKVPLDAAALKLIERSASSREYLHRAAKLQHCDWSLDYQDGPFLLLPHLTKSRTLARLAALHARHEFEQGHWEAGWDDVTAIRRLARHVETASMMIAQLVGYAIDTIAIDSAAPYLPALKSALPQDATRIVDALPAEPTLAQLLLKERQTGPMWLIERLKNAEQRKPGSWQVVWKENLDAIIGASEEERSPLRDLVQSVKTYDQVVKIADFYDELGELLALPWKEFDAQYPKFVEKASSASPLARIYLPNMVKFFSVQRRHQTQGAMFKAALAIVQGGPDKLKEIKDPFGDGPFEYRALDKGFELKSKLLFKGRPVTLTVGAGNKE